MPEFFVLLEVNSASVALLDENLISYDRFIDDASINMTNF